MNEIKDEVFIKKLQKNAVDVLAIIASTKDENDLRTLISLYVETLYTILDLKKFNPKKGV